MGNLNQKLLNDETATPSEALGSKALHKDVNTCLIKLFEKLELTADEGNIYPGVLSRRAFENTFHGPIEIFGKLLYVQMQDGPPVKDRTGPPVKDRITKEQFVKAGKEILKMNDVNEQKKYYFKLFAASKNVLTKEDSKNLVSVCYALTLSLSSIPYSQFENDERIFDAMVNSMYGIHEKLAYPEFLGWMEKHCPHLFCSVHEWVISILRGSKCHMEEVSTPVPELDHILNGRYLINKTILWSMSISLPAIYLAIPSQNPTTASKSNSNPLYSTLLQDLISKARLPHCQTWNLIYSSNDHGLSMNRFSYHVSSYNGPCVTFFYFEGRNLYCFASDCGWRTSTKRIGGDECLLIQFLPFYRIIQTGSDISIWNEHNRGISKGIQLGQAPSPVVLEISFEFDTIKHYGVPCSLYRIEVLGHTKENNNNKHLLNNCQSPSWIYTWTFKQAKQQMTSKKALVTTVTVTMTTESDPSLLLTEEVNDLQSSPPKGQQKVEGSRFVYEEQARTRLASLARTDDVYETSAKNEASLARFDDVYGSSVRQRSDLAQKLVESNESLASKRLLGNQRSNLITYSDFNEDSNLGRTEKLYENLARTENLYEISARGRLLSNQETIGTNEELFKSRTRNPGNLVRTEKLYENVVGTENLYENSARGRLLSNQETIETNEERFKSRARNPGNLGRTDKTYENIARTEKFYENSTRERLLSNQETIETDEESFKSHTRNPGSLTRTDEIYENLTRERLLSIMKYPPPRRDSDGHVLGSANYSAPSPPERDFTYGPLVGDRAFDIYNNNNNNNDGPVVTDRSIFGGSVGVGNASRAEPVARDQSLVRYEDNKMTRPGARYRLLDGYDEDNNNNKDGPLVRDLSLFEGSVEVGNEWKNEPVTSDRSLEEHRNNNKPFGTDRSLIGGSVGVGNELSDGPLMRDRSLYLQGRFHEVVRFGNETMVEPVARDRLLAGGLVGVGNEWKDEPLARDRSLVGYENRTMNKHLGRDRSLLKESVRSEDTWKNEPVGRDRSLADYENINKNEPLGKDRSLVGYETDSNYERGPGPPGWASRNTSYIVKPKPFYNTSTQTEETDLDDYETELGFNVEEEGSIRGDSLVGYEEETAVKGASSEKGVQVRFARTVLVEDSVDRRVQGRSMRKDKAEGHVLARVDPRLQVEDNVARGVKGQFTNMGKAEGHVLARVDPRLQAKDDVVARVDPRLQVRFAAIGSADNDVDPLLHARFTKTGAVDNQVIDSPLQVRCAKTEPVDNDVDPRRFTKTGAAEDDVVARVDTRLQVRFAVTESSANDTRGSANSRHQIELEGTASAVDNVDPRLHVRFAETRSAEHVVDPRLNGRFPKTGSAADDVSPVDWRLQNRYTRTVSTEDDIVAPRQARFPETEPAADEVIDPVDPRLKVRFAETESVAVDVGRVDTRLHVRFAQTGPVDDVVNRQSPVRFPNSGSTEDDVFAPVDPRLQFRFAGTDNIVSMDPSFKAQFARQESVNDIVDRQHLRFPNTGSTDDNVVQPRFEPRFARTESVDDLVVTDDKQFRVRIAPTALVGEDILKPFDDPYENSSTRKQVNFAVNNETFENLATELPARNRSFPGDYSAIRTGDLKPADSGRLPGRFVKSESAENVVLPVNPQLQVRFARTDQSVDNDDVLPVDSGPPRSRFARKMSSEDVVLSIDSGALHGQYGRPDPSANNNLSPVNPLLPRRFVRTNPSADDVVSFVNPRLPVQFARTEPSADCIISPIDSSPLNGLSARTDDFVSSVNPRLSVQSARTQPSVNVIPSPIDSVGVHSRYTKTMSTKDAISPVNSGSLEGRYAGTISTEDVVSPIDSVRGHSRYATEDVKSGSLNREAARTDLSADDVVLPVNPRLPVRFARPEPPADGLVAPIDSFPLHARSARTMSTEDVVSPVDSDPLLGRSARTDAIVSSGNPRRLVQFAKTDPSLIDDVSPIDSDILRARSAKTNDVVLPVVNPRLPVPFARTDPSVTDVVSPVNPRLPLPTSPDHIISPPPVNPTNRPVVTLEQLRSPNRREFIPASAPLLRRLTEEYYQMKINEENRNNINNCNNTINNKPNIDNDNNTINNSNNSMETCCHSDSSENQRLPITINYNNKENINDDNNTINNCNNSVDTCHSDSSEDHRLPALSNRKEIFNNDNNKKNSNDDNRFRSGLGFLPASTNILASSNIPASSNISASSASNIPVLSNISVSGLKEKHSPIKINEEHSNNNNSEISSVKNPPASSNIPVSSNISASSTIPVSSNIPGLSSNIPASSNISASSNTPVSSNISGLFSSNIPSSSNISVSSNIPPSNISVSSNIPASSNNLESVEMRSEINVFKFEKTKRENDNLKNKPRFPYDSRYDQIRKDSLEPMLNEDSTLKPRLSYDQIRTNSLEPMINEDLKVKPRLSYDSRYDQIRKDSLGPMLNEGSALKPRLSYDQIRTNSLEPIINENLKVKPRLSYDSHYDQIRADSDTQGSQSPREPPESHDLQRSHGPQSAEGPQAPPRGPQINKNFSQPIKMRPANLNNEYDAHIMKTKKDSMKKSSSNEMLGFKKPLIRFGSMSDIIESSNGGQEETKNLLLLNKKGVESKIDTNITRIQGHRTEKKGPESQMTIQHGRSESLPIGSSQQSGNLQLRSYSSCTDVNAEDFLSVPKSQYGVSDYMDMSGRYLKERMKFSENSEHSSRNAKKKKASSCTSYRIHANLQPEEDPPPELPPRAYRNLPEDSNEAEETDDRLWIYESLRHRRSYANELRKQARRLNIRKPLANINESRSTETLNHPGIFETTGTTENGTETQTVDTSILMSREIPNKTEVSMTTAETSENISEPRITELFPRITDCQNENEEGVSSQNMVLSGKDDCARNVPRDLSDEGSTMNVSQSEATIGLQAELDLIPAKDSKPMTLCIKQRINFFDDGNPVKKRRTPPPVPAKPSSVSLKKNLHQTEYNSSQLQPCSENNCAVEKKANVLSERKLEIKLEVHEEEEEKTVENKHEAIKQVPLKNTENTNMYKSNENISCSENPEFSFEFENFQIDSSLNKEFLARKKNSLRESLRKKLQVLKEAKLNVETEIKEIDTMKKNISREFERVCSNWNESRKLSDFFKDQEMCQVLLSKLKVRISRLENEETTLGDHFNDKLSRLRTQFSEAEQLSSDVNDRQKSLNRLLEKYLSETSLSDFNYVLTMRPRLVEEMFELEEKIFNGGQKLVQLEKVPY